MIDDLIWSHCVFWWCSDHVTQTHRSCAIIRRKDYPTVLAKGEVTLLILISWPSILTLTLIKLRARLRSSLICAKWKLEKKNEIIEASVTQNILTQKLDIYTTHLHNVTQFTYHTDAHSPVHAIFNYGKFTQVIKIRKKEKQLLKNDTY